MLRKGRTGIVAHRWLWPVLSLAAIIGLLTLFSGFVTSRSEAKGREDAGLPASSMKIAPSTLQESVAQTFSVQIANSGDDVEERLSDGYIYKTSSDLELGDDPGTLGEQTVGLRFQAVGVPRNATIQEAYIEFQVDSTDAVATTVSFRAQAADNPVAFSNAAHDLTSRPQTQAQVTWANIPAWSQSGVKQRSPDLSSLVQEIVNRGGWQTGNSIVIIVDGNGTRTADSYDGNPDGAPRLYIQFGSDAPSPTPTTTGTPTGTPPASTEKWVRIGQASDDVEERLSDGYMYMTSSDLELGDDPGTLGEQTVGLRFRNVGVPRNATIQEAYVEFQVDSTDTVATTVIFSAQAADNPLAFSSATHDLTSRPQTQALVVWSNIPAWSKSGVKQRSPDLSPILQEIVNRGGWQAGNSIVIIVEGSGTRSAEAYEGDPDGAARLYVRFGPSGSPQPTPTSTTTPPSAQTATSTPTPTSTATPTSTPTARPPAASIRFAVIGDFGADTSALQDVAAMIQAENVDQIVTVGDNRYSANAFDTVIGQYFCSFLAGISGGNHCPTGDSPVNGFFPALGNHDYNDGGGINQYLSYFDLPGPGVASSQTSGNERYYDVISGPVHFFILDSEAARNSSSELAAQRAWLQAQVAASAAPWQVVVMHHPPYTSPSSHSSNSALQWPYREWGVDAVLAGHNHFYERIFREGIVYFVNGLGGRSIYSINGVLEGSQVRYNGDYGAMIVDGDALSLRFRFLSRIGVVIDDYTLTQAAPTTPTATSTTTRSPTPSPTRSPTPTSTAIAGLTSTPTATSTGITTSADLIAGKLEVTQGVQNLRNSVPLVTNKRTFVRFHARTDQGVVRAPAQLIAQRGSAQVVLRPVNGQNSALDLRTSPDRKRMDDAFLFELPNGFREGSVTLTGELNPQGTLNEANRGNNSTTVTVSFQTVPPLYLVLYNVSYSYQGHINAVSDFHLDRIEAWLRQAYPAHEIQVVRRSLYAGSGVPTCDTGDLLDDMRNARIQDLNNPAIPDNAVYYGVVYDGGPDNQFMRGRGGGFVACGPTGVPQGSWSWDTDGSFGDWYGGHEIGHAYGEPHSPCGVSGDAAFPNPGGLISPTQSGERAVYGFNAATMEIYPADWADVMSYCPKQWTSDYTYQQLLKTFQTFGSRFSVRMLDDRQDRLQVNGFIISTGDEAVLSPLVVLPNVADVIERIPGPYTILLRDADGQELARYPFTPRASPAGPPPPGTTEGEEPPDDLSVHELVPYVTGTARVEILGPAGDMIGLRQAGVGTPAISISAPAPNAILNGESVDVVWSATDADDDNLTFSVLFSADGGENWRLVASTIVTDSVPMRVTIPRGNLTQSANARFRVMASDGIHTGMAETEGSLVVPNLPPTVQIEADSDALTVYTGESLTLVGSGYDGDDGTLAESQLTWHSDIDGALGSGHLLSTVSLGLGRHTILLRGEDAVGATGIAEIEVTVESLPTASWEIFLPLLDGSHTNSQP